MKKIILNIGLFTTSFLFTLLVAVSAQADLIFWTPVGHSLPFVLPEGVTPEIYLENIRSAFRLTSFVKNLEVSAQDQIVISTRASMMLAKDQASFTVLVANDAQDHQKEHPRIDHFAPHFQNTFILPIGATLGLTSNQEQDFYRELGEKFGLVVFMGGDDKDPRLWGEEITWSKKTNYLRDLLEQNIIRGLYFKTKIRVFGVCRGLQQVFTSLGGKLHQDIPQDLHVTEEHQNGAKHPIVFETTVHNIVKSLLPSNAQDVVNSYHHQSARIDSVKGTIFQVAAHSPEGVVEALESRDGRIALVQFHPEEPGNGRDYSKTFFSNLKLWSGERSSASYGSCRRFF